MKPWDLFVLGQSPGDRTHFFPLRSSGSRNRSVTTNNTKEDRSDDKFHLSRECAHSLEEAPTSQGASADEWATCFPQRINGSEDRSTTLITTLSPDPLDELDGHLV